MHNEQDQTCIVVVMYFFLLPFLYDSDLIIACVKSWAAFPEPKKFCKFGQSKHLKKTFPK